MFPLFMYGDWALAALRIVLGLILIAHGWLKLKDLKTTASNFAGMGFKPGALWGAIAAAVEFFGGLALILGLWTQLSAIFIAGEFAVIILWRLRNKQKLVGGYEFDLLILVAVLLFFTQGADEFSLDRYLWGAF